jgi:hypothetical protein
MTSQIAGNANFFDDFEIVSIHLGVNDFAGNWALGSIFSASTDANIGGYMKKMIDLILTSNPNAKIFFIAPPEANGLGVTYKAENTQGWTLKDLSVLMSNIAAYYGVSCVDLYDLAPFNLYTIPTYTVDLLHPNAIGKEIIANIVANSFKEGYAKGMQTNLAFNDLTSSDDIRKFHLNGNTSAKRLDFTDGTNAILSVRGDGRIGIGTTNPTKTVQVGSNVGIGSDGVIDWGNGLTGNSRGKLTWDTNKAIVQGQQQLGLNSGGNERVLLDLSGNVVLGTQSVLATNATNGFCYIPTCSGTPTGTPATYATKVPMVMDTLNNKLYVYSGGAWIAMN